MALKQTGKDVLGLDWWMHLEEKWRKIVNPFALLLLIGGGIALLAKVFSNKKVFVSFDWDNDKHYKHLMDAWHENDKFEFVYEDGTATEIKSNNIQKIKEGLIKKIEEADVTLVLIGEYANTTHKDWMSIGYKNWINFEVGESKKRKKPLVAVKLDKSNESPEELLGANAKWAMAFTEEAILREMRKV